MEPGIGGPNYSDQHRQQDISTETIGIGTGQKKKKKLTPCLKTPQPQLLLQDQLGGIESNCMYVHGIVSLFAFRHAREYFFTQKKPRSIVHLHKPARSLGSKTNSTLLSLKSSLIRPKTSKLGIKRCGHRIKSRKTGRVIVGHDRRNRKPLLLSSTSCGTSPYASGTSMPPTLLVKTITANL